MTLNQILPLIDSLPHTDKFQLMQILLNKIAAEENINLSQVAMENKTVSSPVKSIRDNPAFGMWADRTDSTQEQLQGIRQQHWTR